MSRAEPWMPFYVGDYLRDTTRLTTEQHGAYLLLIADYWSNGTPPDDDRILAQITRLDLKRWKQNRPVLAAFFIVSGGVWQHKRIEAELERSRLFREKQQANGKRGGRPKKTQSESQGKPRGFGRDNPNDNPNESLSQSQSQKVIPIDKSIGAPDPEKLLFDSGVQLLSQAGTSETKARQLLGKWKRDYGAADVISALSRAQREGAIEPISFIEGCLRALRRPSRTAEMPC